MRFARFYAIEEDRRRSPAERKIVIAERIGGRDRDRTCDLMLAKHALSQLSYTPILAIELV
jgi:hypothetical protein